MSLMFSSFSISIMVTYMLFSRIMESKVIKYDYSHFFLFYNISPLNAPYLILDTVGQRGHYLPKVCLVSSNRSYFLGTAEIVSLLLAMDHPKQV